MQPDVAAQLLQINREFYDRFAASYSASRRVLQPGIGRALTAIAPFDSLIDVACGDGRVVRGIDPSVRYTGVDFSAGLLAEADAEGGDFHQVDMSSPGWETTLDLPVFDAAVCFSAFHHLPGSATRDAAARGIASLVAPGGRIAISVWQFLREERFRKKILPWSHVGLTEADVEPGDVLLDWHRDGTGWRYVHEFDEESLVDLCERATLSVLETYRDDGNLGLYVIAQRVD